MEEIEKIISEGKKEMEKSFQHLKKVFSQIRSGKANPNILNSINIEYYGKFTPLSQIANINIVNSITLSIQSWDKNMLSTIYRAIINANIGFTPINNGEVILINFPPLTEELRKELVKKAKSDTELTKISLRNIRKEINHNLKEINISTKDLVKISEERIQKITNFYIKKTDELFSLKEREILTI